MKIYFVSRATTLQKNPSSSFKAWFVLSIPNNPTDNRIWSSIFLEDYENLYAVIMFWSFAWEARLWPFWRLGIWLLQFCIPSRDLWTQFLFSRCLLKKMKKKTHKNEWIYWHLVLQNYYFMLSIFHLSFEKNVLIFILIVLYRA